MKKLIVQLIKFGIVGVIATVVDVGVLTVLKELFDVDVMIASALGFTVSVTVNYVLSMLFVFENSGRSKAGEFVIFVLLSIGGLGINQGVMWIGTMCTEAYYLWVKAFALFIVPVYNFVTRKLVLEKKQTADSEK